jgi:hypothetical protein
MLILGVLQIQARPRKKDDTLYQRFVNIGTLWSLCCITVGVGILLMALGYWTPSFLQGPQRPPVSSKKHR